MCTLARLCTPYEFMGTNVLDSRRHAAFLVELPTPPGAARGPRILFDPALSARCFMVQWAGPSRYTDVPCDLTDIPAIDAIVISVSTPLPHH